MAGNKLRLLLVKVEGMSKGSKRVCVSSSMNADSRLSRMVPAWMFATLALLLTWAAVAQPYTTLPQGGRWYCTSMGKSAETEAFPYFRK